MRGRRTGLQVTVDSATRTQLEGLLRRQKTPAGLAKRARAVLLVADGQRLRQTAVQVGFTERNLRKWLTRFLAQGLAGLQDAPRTGRPPVFSPGGGAARDQDGVRTPG
jgi:DNA-binding CsgD family transcriptional regulator